jgi:hypothetical protein
LQVSFDAFHAFVASRESGLRQAFNALDMGEPFRGQGFGACLGVQVLALRSWGFSVEPSAQLQQQAVALVSTRNCTALPVHLLIVPLERNTFNAAAFFKQHTRHT